MTCPVNDDFNPSTQLEYLEKLHFDHQKRIENEAAEIYLKEFFATRDHDYARFMYFRHLHIYL